MIIYSNERACIEVSLNAELDYKVSAFASHCVMLMWCQHLLNTLMCWTVTNLWSSADFGPKMPAHFCPRTIKVLRVLALPILFLVRALKSESYPNHIISSYSIHREIQN